MAGSPSRVVKHGAHRYSEHHCRCPTCVTAKADAIARWRATLDTPCPAVDCTNIGSWAGAECSTCRTRRHRAKLVFHAALQFSTVKRRYVLDASRRAGEIKAQLRADAAKLALQLEYFDPVGRIATPPRRVFRNRRWQRDQAEWEWFDELDDGLKRLVVQHSSPTGTPPDALYLSNRDWDPETGPDLWLDNLRRLAGARSMAAGRAPQFATAAEVFRGASPTATSLEDIGATVDLLFAAGWFDARARFAADLADSEAWMVERAAMHPPVNPRPALTTI